MTRLTNKALCILSRTVLAFACILLCAEIAAAHDVALVTHKNSPVKGVKATDLAQMIKSGHQWPGGQELMIVITDPSSLEMRIVAQKLLSLTRNEFKQLIDATNKNKMTFWIVPSDAEALRILQANTSAIAVMNVYSINSTVDVLKIDGLLPLEPGYVLHSQ
jgi:hypothetical protein